MAILLTVAAALLVPPVAWADDATGFQKVQATRMHLSNAPTGVGA